MGVTASDAITRVLALLFVLLTPFLLWWFTLQVRRGKKYTFRRLPALEKLRDLLVLATERGKKVHLSLGSSVRGLTGGIQDSPSVVLAVIAAALAGGTLVGQDADQSLVTVLAVIAATALLTGIVFLR